VEQQVKKEGRARNDAGCVATFEDELIDLSQ
jgi:hypothetical protein